MSHLDKLPTSTQPNDFTWNFTPHLAKFVAPCKQQITEITDVSIPGIDATVIVGVLTHN